MLAHITVADQQHLQQVIVVLGHFAAWLDGGGTPRTSCYHIECATRASKGSDPRFTWLVLGLLVRFFFSGVELLLPKHTWIGWCCFVVQVTLTELKATDKAMLFVSSLLAHLLSVELSVYLSVGWC